MFPRANYDGAASCAPIERLRFGDCNESPTLAPERRALFVQWHRAFGVLLCPAGLLFAVNSVVVANHQPWMAIFGTQEDRVETDPEVIPGQKSQYGKFDLLGHTSSNAVSGP